ncbi:MAG: flagellar basal body rod protein FlgB [Congregibacter sp.]
MGPIEKAMGMSPQVMALRAQRMELLSANIANADTPGYKARDIDFEAAMRTARSDQEGMMRTHPKHMSAGGMVDDGAAKAMYRMPSQPSMDGNTVETHREHAAFMDNAMRYQASVNMLDSRIRGLQTAIRGQV